MGSFTSMSKVIPATDADKDVEHEFCLIGKERILDQTRKEDLGLLDNFLNHCSKRLAGLPQPIPRKWKDSSTTIHPIDTHIDSVTNGVHCKEEDIRVLQWNVLSQSKCYVNFAIIICLKTIRYCRISSSVLFTENIIVTSSLFKFLSVHHIYVYVRLHAPIFAGSTINSFVYLCDVLYPTNMCCSFAWI